MNNNSKMSVIVPFLNSEKTISKCINSILAQDYPYFELLLIDSGSNDNSYKICSNFNDERITLYKAEKRGVSKARNIGLENADGDYVVFCDADDFYSNDYLSVMINAARENKAEIVICGYYILSNNNQREICGEKSHFIERRKIIESLFLDNKIGGFCWNKLFSSKIAKYCRFPEDLSHCEDTYFLMKALAISSSAYYINKPLYYYVSSNQSATRNFDKIISTNHYLQYTIAYQKIINDFEFNNDEKEIFYLLIFETSIIYGWKYFKDKGIDKEFIENIVNDVFKYWPIYAKSDLPSFKKKIKRRTQMVILKYF